MSSCSLKQEILDCIKDINFYKICKLLDNYSKTWTVLCEDWEESVNRVELWYLINVPDGFRPDVIFSAALRLPS